MFGKSWSLGRLIAGRLIINSAMKRYQTGASGRQRGRRITSGRAVHHCVAVTWSVTRKMYAHGF